MLRVNNLAIQFDNNLLFKELSFEVNKGEKVCLIGESGKGKTSLLNALAGFTIPQRGEIIIDKLLVNATTIHKIRNRMAWIPQELSLPVSTARELLYFPISFHANKDLYPESSAIKELFSIFGLEIELLEQSFATISGGQKQRLALITGLLLRKNLLILDEPTSALDAKNKEAILDYLFNLPELTIISASHDDAWIQRCDKIINLNNF